MSNTVLITPVDTLVNIVKEQQPCTITKLKQQLRLPSQLIEKWLVILEEFEIITVNYKGLEGIVKIREKEFKQEELSTETLRDAFIERCIKKKITFSKMGQIWPVFIKEFETPLKELFFEEAKKKGHTKSKIEPAWLKFRKELQRF